MFLSSHSTGENQAKILPDNHGHGDEITIAKLKYVATIQHLRFGHFKCRELLKMRKRDVYINTCLVIEM